VHFWKNFCRTLVLSVLNSAVFLRCSIVCQLATTTDLIELSIRNIVKRENKKQTKQHSRTGCEQNLWPFLVLWKGHLSQCPHLFGCNWASKGQERCAVFMNVNLLCDTVHKLAAKHENRIHFGASSMCLCFL